MRTLKIAFDTFLFSKTILIAATLVAFISCTKNEDTPSSKTGAELEKVILLTDWYAQPEHGGFYQALANGFYEEAGLDVEIRPGGGLPDVRTLVASGQVDITVGITDSTLIGISRGLPLVALAPYFQHDPQCIMFHASQNIESLQDLHEKRVMIQPSNSYVAYMQEKLGIHLNLIPHDYSTARIATDPEFIQQCFITSEPIYLAEQGVDIRAIPLHTSGYDPYRHMVTSRKFLDSRPDVARKFTLASIRGWKDFIQGDPTPALDLIAQANPQQKPAIMTKIVSAMKANHLVAGKQGYDAYIGKFEKTRLAKQLEDLKALGIINQTVTLEQSFAMDLLPEVYLD